MKQVIVVVMMLAVFGGLASAATLISEYKFDGDVSNTVNAALDGTIIGTTAYVEGYALQPATAIEFFGLAAVATGTDGQPAVAAGLESGSISFWMKSGGPGGQDTAFIGNFNLADSMGFYLTVTALDEWRIFCRDSGGANWQIVCNASTAWRDGNWHHIAATWDSSAPAAAIYVDGAELTSVVSGSAATNFAVWQYSNGIGAFNNRNTVAAHYTGVLDEFKIYTGELTPAEVADLAVSPTAATLQTPVDGEIDVIAGTNLTWQTARDPNFPTLPNPNITAQKVYLGTDPGSLALAATLGATDEIYAPATIKNNTYYWRIDEVIGGNDYPSAVWSFTTVLELPIITVQPQGAKLPLGGTAVGSITAEDPLLGTLSYQWYLQGTPDVAVGTNSDTLTIDPITAGDFGFYYCVVTNVLGSTTSDLAELQEGFLTAHYKFDDAVGNTAIDQFGINGAVAGTASWIAGIDTGALAFDGASNYVDITTAGLPDANTLGDQGTISFWISKSTDTMEYVMGTYNDGAAAAIQLSIGDEGNGGSEVRLYARPNNTAVSLNLGAFGPANDGAWHLCTIAWNLSNPALSAVYVDGERQAFSQYGTFSAVEAISPWQYPLVIGGRNIRGPVSGWLDGSLDDYRVYDYALSPIEVANLYVNFNPGATVCLEYPAMDFSGNCIVDIADFAIFASNWLECNSVPDCIN